jgi:zinc transporter ZupT
MLKIIESRSSRVGRFVAGLLGMAWSVTTYFVVPVLVVEKAGPVDAFKRSTTILRRTWGEALVGNFGIGFIVFLVFLAALVPAVVGFLLGTAVTIVAGIAVTVVLLVLVSLVSSAANAILVGALYEYATADAPPAHFDEGLLRSAFVSR